MAGDKFRALRGENEEMAGRNRAISPILHELGLSAFHNGNVKACPEFYFMGLRRSPCTRNLASQSFRDAHAIRKGRGGRGRMQVGGWMRSKLRLRLGDSRHDPNRTRRT